MRFRLFVQHHVEPPMQYGADLYTRLGARLLMEQARHHWATRGLNSRFAYMVVIKPKPRVKLR